MFENARVVELSGTRALRWRARDRLGEINDIFVL